MKTRWKSGIGGYTGTPGSEAAPMAADDEKAWAASAPDGGDMRAREAVAASTNGARDRITGPLRGLCLWSMGFMLMVLSTLFRDDMSRSMLYRK